MDTSFNEVIPPEYDVVSVISDELVYVGKKNGENFDYYKYENDELSYYKTEKWEINGDTETLGIFVDIPNSKYGAVDKNLNVIAEPKYDNDVRFENDYAVVLYGSTDFVNIKGLGFIFNEKYGVIDKKGNYFINPEYDKILRIDATSFIAIKDNKKEIFSADGELPNTDSADDWAKQSIICGNFYGIIPDELKSDYTAKITRAEFCRLALKTYSQLCGDYKINEYADYPNPFNDTDDKYIIIANALGIVSGRGNGKFAPNDTITRQESAVMLVNLAKLIGYNLDEEKKAFTDSAYFADWAKSSIYKITNFKGDEGISVMTGTGNGKFSPWFSYSREQAIATMVRIYDINRQTFRNDYLYYKGQ